jgi:peptidoglycan/LPS O-acetylase OafA/YrhL
MPGFESRQVLLAATGSPIASTVTLAKPPLPPPASAGTTAAALIVRKPALPALSGLRTLLAVNIMLFHFTPPLPGWWLPVVNNAYVFVGFFFLISGFVLAYNYADRPNLSHRTFYVARLARVYPVYLLVLLLSLPFLKVEWGAHSHAAFFLGLGLTPLALQGWSPWLATFWNTVGWTLPAELFLYFLFPYLLRLERSQAHRLRTPLRLACAILLLWVIGLIPHTVYLLTNPDHLPGPATRYTYAFWLRALKYTPPAYLCVFAAGILLARLHRVRPLTARERAVGSFAALAGLAVFFGFLASRVPYVLVHGTLLLPLFAMLLLALSGSGPVSSVLAWRPLALFGETTFALYLLHFNAFLLIHFYKLPQRLHVERFDPWISYVAIMLLALAVLHLYERPSRRWVLARFSTRTNSPQRSS